MIEGLELLEVQIASILDNPSVYMGGPSQQSRRRAKRIIELLKEEKWLRDNI